MISLIAPAYNEEEVIGKFVRSIFNNIKLGEEWEMIVVNDGSTDRTGAILQELQAVYPGLRVITHAINQNLGGALHSGIEKSRGRIVITMDADMSHPFDLIGAMIEKLKDNDVCVPSRYVSGGGMLGVPLHRRWISRMSNMIYQILFLSSVKDNTGGFKAYRGDLLRSLVIEEKSFAVQLEIVTRLLIKKARFAEIPYVLVNRELGISKLNYTKVLPVYGRCFFKFLMWRWLSH